jgi:hypothetical protein
MEQKVHFFEHLTPFRFLFAPLPLYRVVHISYYISPISYSNYSSVVRELSFVIFNITSLLFSLIDKRGNNVCQAVRHSDRQPLEREFCSYPTLNGSIYHDSWFSLHSCPVGYVLA